MQQNQIQNDMSKREMVALAAIVASAYAMDSKESVQSMRECYGAAFADMKDECFIK